MAIKLLIMCVLIHLLIFLVIIWKMKHWKEVLEAQMTASTDYHYEIERRKDPKTPRPNIPFQVKPKKKGRVYNPSKDLDRQMRGGNVEFFS